MERIVSDYAEQSMIARQILIIHPSKRQEKKEKTDLQFGFKR